MYIYIYILGGAASLPLPSLLYPSAVSSLLPSSPSSHPLSPTLRPLLHHSSFSTLLSSALAPSAFLPALHSSHPRLSTRRLPPSWFMIHRFISMGVQVFLC